MTADCHLLLLLYTVYCSVLLLFVILLLICSLTFGLLLLLAVCSVVNFLVKLLSELATATAREEAALQQAKSASTQAEKVMKENENLQVSNLFFPLSTRFCWHVIRVFCGSLCAHWCACMYENEVGRLMVFFPKLCWTIDQFSFTRQA